MAISNKMFFGCSYGQIRFDWVINKRAKLHNGLKPTFVMLNQVGTACAVHFVVPNVAPGADLKPIEPVTPE